MNVNPVLYPRRTATDEMRKSATSRLRRRRARVDTPAPSRGVVGCPLPPYNRRTRCSGCAEPLATREDGACASPARAGGRYARANGPQGRTPDSAALIAANPSRPPLSADRHIHRLGALALSRFRRANDGSATCDAVVVFRLTVRRSRKRRRARSDECGTGAPES